MAVVATLSKGYDLDYIWKQVDRGPAKDAASYYIQASESGGEPPGRWWGPGAQALGFEPGQRVERKPYDLLFGERKAPDGTPLGRPPGGGRKAADLYAALLAAEPHATAERRRELRTEATQQARQSPLFFDLTLSLSKSISLFHASLGENTRLARQAGDKEGDAYWSALVTEVDDMIYQAVHAGFGYFQREAGYTRTGSHNTRVNGKETGQWHEADLAVAHWLQHTSRDGDMQLHVHSQIAHTAKTATDGKWRAPDSLGYNEHIGAVAAIVSQHLEEALTARFGLEWTARDDGHGFGQLVRQQQAEARQRERIDQELKIAQIIQQQFLPKTVPDLPSWHVAAFYRPARTVGGDFYDFIPLPDGRVMFVVGDVTDKGVPAALVMASTHALLRDAAPRLISPGQVLGHVNDMLCADIPAHMFVTCLALVLDPVSGQVEFANAGHDVPYVRTKDGVAELRARGMPLGLMPGMDYEEMRFQFEPGDCALLHSDGLAEAHAPDREMFGFPRVSALVGKGPSGEALIDLCLTELSNFTGPEHEQEDDITLVSLQRSPSAWHQKGGGSR